MVVIFADTGIMKLIESYFSSPAVKNACPQRQESAENYISRTATLTHHVSALQCTTMLTIIIIQTATNKQLALRPQESMSST